MISHVIAWLFHFIVHTVSSFGYAGIIIMMAIESACIPLPSEIIMPFSGYLVSLGRFNFWAVAGSGAVGNLLGSLLIYGLAQRSVTPKFLNGSHSRHAQIFFEKYGTISVFIGRILPVIRTFISLPAGLIRVPLLTFSLLTLLGSFLWALLLTYLGMTLGRNWTILELVFHRIDIGLLAVLAGGIGYWLWKSKLAVKQ